MQALWDCYVASGSDTDGNTRWHCSPEQAAKNAVRAVEDLRVDYDNALIEMVEWEDGCEE